MRALSFGETHAGNNMEAKFDIANYVERIGERLVREIEEARALGADSNAKGAGIESATRRQLKLLLPDIRDVGQGYIIDSYGGISRQIDLIVFERSFCPVFSVNDSPESTYYPCEGVLAAIEIKSGTGRKEFLDSCQKATSVRNLRRRFSVESDGNARNIRRYGDVGRWVPVRGDAIVPYGIRLDRFQYADILTVLMTGKVNVSQNTVASYYNETRVSAPDILVSLDGLLAVFQDSEWIVTSARLGSSCMISKYENPFSVFIHLLYRWVSNGHTVAFEEFQNYFHLPSS